MKKLLLQIIIIYFKVIPRFSEKIAVKHSLNLFQRPTHRAYKPNEIDFFSKANHFKLNFQDEALDAYEIGSENQNLVIIVHGWGSNLGRLSKIAFRLQKEGYRVVGINFPAHGDSKSKLTNMFQCKNAILELLKYLNPQKPFQAISHSFGSGVTALALKESDYEVDKMVFLTSANKFSEIFLDFQKMIQLNNRIFDKMNDSIIKSIGVDFMKLKVEDILKDIKYDKLLLIHDIYDKTLPYHYSKEIYDNSRDTELMTLENKGHSGMLFENEVIDRIVGFIM